MKFNIDTENITYVKMFYKDENANSNFLKVLIKKITKDEIHSLVKLKKDIIINTPQDVELGIATENGIYKAVTVLKQTEYEYPFLYLVLKTPENMQYYQNREYFRVKLKENATISFQTENDIKNVACETVDISANGVKCIIEKSIEFPEYVQMTLYFQNKNIKTNAKFIRIDEDGDFYEVSFSFIDLKETDLDFISQICIKKQIQEKRKMLL